MEQLHFDGDKLTSRHKANLFELTIPLSNNAALCLFKEENYAESLNYSKNVSAATSACLTQDLCTAV